MLSTYGGNVYAEVLAGKQSAPATFYLALLTAIPGPDDTGTDIAVVEPVGASYARVLISGGADWSTASGGICTYADPIVYLPLENWGTITAYALCTAATAGMVLHYDYMEYPVTIKAGSTVTIPVNSIGMGVVV